LFNAADDRRTVGIANFFRDHSDRVSALVAQRAGKEIRTVIQLFGGCMDSILGLLRDRTRGGGIVQNRLDSARSESYMLSNGL
jgi:hypothetical protein